MEELILGVAEGAGVPTRAEFGLAAQAVVEARAWEAPTGRAQATEVATSDLGMNIHKLHPKVQPALLILQQFAVGGRLHIQGQLNIHELRVLVQLPGHVLLGGSESSLQLSDLDLSILESQLPTLLSISNGGLQGSILAFEGLHLSLESADVPIPVRNPCLPVMLVIPGLPSQCWQLLLLYLVHGLSLCPAAVGDLILGLNLGHDAVQVQGTVVHGQHYKMSALPSGTPAVPCSHKLPPHPS